MVMFEAEGVRQETMRSDVYPRHGMMAGATHDELAAQKYFLGLRAYANGRLMAQAIDACNEKVMPEMGERDPEAEEDRKAGAAQVRGTAHLPALGGAAAHVPGTDVGLRGRHRRPATGGA